MSHGLNTPQRNAVNYMDGPCLVLAGAGSGKTRVITQKIVNLIELHGYEPKHIAALTFTNKAAMEMQERIAKLLAEPRQARQLTVSTFHSLGVKILRQEAQALGLKDRFSIMDSDDCFSLVQDLAITTDKQLIRRIQTAMSLWKNALIDPETALKQAIDEDEAIAARIYRSYVATLSAYQAVDFDDLIRLPVELFRSNEQVRDKWQRRLRYLLVDEYQDTNTCQYELVKLLVTGVGKKPMFTAVGDDDQAIYAWRGATIENLTTLQVDFPDLVIIKLEQNYRSSTRILQAANAVIGNNPKLFEKSLWSEHGLGDPVKVLGMQDDEQEAEQVAIMISAHRFERRANYSDYAILYRGNHQARVIEQALRKERIPYTISGGQSFFDRAEIKDIISYLRLIANEDDDPAFIRAITTPKRGVGQATLEVLGAFAGQWQCSLFAAVFKGGLEAKLTERQLRPLRDFATFINHVEAHAHREGQAGELLDDLMKEINYEAYLYDSFDDRAAQGKWQNVLDFTQWLKTKGSGGKEGTDEHRSLLDLTQMVALMTMMEGKDEAPDAVRMSTLHASKGLEYPHVFLVGVEEGILPHKGDPDAPADTIAARIQEERRLMYVGITRAQRTLHITWCKKRKRAGAPVHCDVSRFVKEMQLDEGTAVPTEAETLTPRERLARLKDLLASGKQAGGQ
ncbi:MULTISPECIES: UvrD-helicase domain-containing protein [unclassified Undibacterium]|uniref:UvrD-helicase domain-containing protein n=1 Tax=unclassified Undibacterium TaxID=2630295 RepID=UPI002AC9898B|nr:MULTISPECIES: UvrD-helicase domain-containing protein [unclassified Undibacterium]MEB0138830.1 UvrD-helicase domain-containing protein [Undibacterium sp. CCC2.1]MEB0172308.1 UvrD-helicase domain-containing protein [Undibacterium sp. CCC1.1]MEB0176075.1 UvrD-helicase domain-containing protein [Undibacterium sp. CCC3.4]MEB0216931.1 UvrD-helicase domain-containing protein [Undibacterium sp. 5I2]WPX44782.1 UvrD-helicase domain-containing protein [Undibacterium sp. CCC3.4]